MSAWPVSFAVLLPPLLVPATLFRLGSKSHTFSSSGVNGSRSCSFRFGNQAHPAVEALTVGISLLLAQHRGQGVLFVTAGCLLALLP